MNDPRLQVFRKAVEGLVESLDALVRLSRWSDSDPKPAPLEAAANKLADRLGAAGELTSAKFHGSATDAKKATAMRDVLKRLDAAYVTYREQIEGKEAGSEANADAIAALETELAETTANSATWR